LEILQIRTSKKYPDKLTKYSDLNHSKKQEINAPKKTKPKNSEGIK
jgi:hypothetical protein